MIDAYSSSSHVSRLEPQTPIRLWTNPLIAPLAMLILVWTIVVLVLGLMGFGLISAWRYLRRVFWNAR